MSTWRGGGGGEDITIEGAFPYIVSNPRVQHANDGRSFAVRYGVEYLLHFRGSINRHLHTGGGVSNDAYNPGPQTNLNRMAAG